ncbi:MAG: hypothetical protein E7406_07695 [Ruminococcaceae bacterium]|nr:hypothetical protein [Oscillospiraceae bacterium]
MLFFAVCACFALFPEKVLYGAQTGLALCINVVIPSLLPFMLITTCVIKSNFSRPLGILLGKVLTPITNMSPDGCICFITGILGGYGAGARAIYENYKQKRISLAEAERLMAFCNNAGPLFVMGTIGVGFFLSKTVGIALLVIQVITSLICARLFSGNFVKEKSSVREEWDFYKKNKPSLGELIISSAIESGSAIINVCVFVITFSAVLEILPFGEYPFLSGILEVTRGVAEISRTGTSSLPVISALIAWGGMSVHLQADSLSGGLFGKKLYYAGKICASLIAFFIAKVTGTDIYVIMFASVISIAVLLVLKIVKNLFFREYTRQHEYRQQPHS